MSRPPLDLDVPAMVFAYQRGATVYAIGAVHGCCPGTVWKRLKAVGAMRDRLMITQEDAANARRAVDAARQVVEATRQAAAELTRIARKYRVTRNAVLAAARIRGDRA